MPLSTRTARGFCEGERVEVLYRGLDRYYPGSIERVNSDGTYNIHYDDGEKESKVKAALVKTTEGLRRRRKVEVLADGQTAIKQLLGSDYGDIEVSTGRANTITQT